MICKVLSAGIFGASVFEVCVEADIAGGLPGFYMVGLPSNEVREAKERVIRAIINSGFEFPARKVTINLSPAYMRKHGSGLDLPIAVAILSAMGVIHPEAVRDRLFIGELSLDGSVNKVRGILPVTRFAREQGMECIVVPEGNAFEGAAIDGIRVHGAATLKSLAEELNSGIIKDVEHIDLDRILEHAYTNNKLDYADVRGQETAKKATLAAVSGFHNIMYIGPPGAGKSMLAKRIPTIFTRMSADECLEVSMIYSIAGLLENDRLMLERPFRAPNQGITDPALVGGGSNPRPGEITLAHRGVLFLDEFAEFKKSTVDQLRAPMENGRVIINRSFGSAEYPCEFMLAAATNPCRCGYYPDRRYCCCSETDVSRYISRIKGPVLDRIDICVGVSRVGADDLGSTGSGMSSAEMRDIAAGAIKIQRERFRNDGILFNAQMDKKLADRYCVMEPDAEKVLRSAYDKFNMTARGWYKIIKVSRTLADLEEEQTIKKKHILEAIGYRNQFLSRQM